MYKQTGFFFSEQITHPFSRKTILAGLTSAMVVFTSTGAPLMAQMKQTTSVPVQVSQNQNSLQEEDAFLKLSASEGIGEDFLQEANKILEEETRQWSQIDKNALKGVIALNLEIDDLEELATLPENELKNRLKSDPKLGQLNAALQPSSENTKILAVALLGGHFTSILKSLWAGIRNGTIRSTPNLRTSSLISALANGDMQQFYTLLNQAFPDATAFVEAMSTGAAFACNTATLQFGARNLCPRFSNFIRGIVRRAATLRSSNPVFDVASVDALNRQKPKERNGLNQKLA